MTIGDLLATVEFEKKLEDFEIRLNNIAVAINRVSTQKLKAGDIVIMMQLIRPETLAQRNRLAKFINVYGHEERGETTLKVQFQSSETFGQILVKAGVSVAENDKLTVRSNGGDEKEVNLSDIIGEYRFSDPSLFISGGE